MTSGLAGDDSSLGGDDDIMERDAQEPRLGASHPGPAAGQQRRAQSWAYSDANSQLLSAIVADATGQSTLAFARAKLFGPLGIAADNALEPTIRHWPPTPAELEAYEQAPVAWPKDPQGYHCGGTFLRLPARDLAKLGYLYLNGGRWDGAQVVPADYVAASTQPQSDPTRGPGDYGYHWWVTNETGHDSFRAMGFGGQLIQVIPELDLVVVITSDSDQERYDAPNLVGDDDRPGRHRLAVLQPVRAGSRPATMPVGRCGSALARRVPLRGGRNARPVSSGPSGPTRGQAGAPAAASRPWPSQPAGVGGEEERA